MSVPLGQSAKESSIGTTPPTDPYGVSVAMIAAYLATHDAQCVKCKQQLRGVAAAQCPKCDAPLGLMFRWLPQRQGEFGAQRAQVAEYLRGRDAACPHCGAAAAGHQGAECPSCGERLTVEALKLDKPYAVRRQAVPGWAVVLVLVVLFCLFAYFFARVIDLKV